MTQLALYLLGTPQLELDGEPVDTSRRKAIALLAYLAMTAQEHGRDTLAALLWPDLDQSRARAALRRTLSELNIALNGVGLEIGRETVGLGRENEWWFDVDQFRQQFIARQKHSHPASEVCPACLPLLVRVVELYRGDFMAGFSLRDSSTFDEWQLFQAENLRRERDRGFNWLVSGYSDQGEFEVAITYARRWLEVDPTQEKAHRQLMRLYTWTAQRPAAIRQYEECLRILRKELDLPPSMETTALFESIKTGRPPAPAARSGTQQPEREAVLQPPVLLPASNLPTRRPFVARESELAELNRALRMVISGSGQVMLVTGEAGSGKTVLVHEFARRAQALQPELVFVAGNCNAYTGLGDPYLPFREMLALLTGTVEPGRSGMMFSRENTSQLAALQPISTWLVQTLGPALIDTFVPRPALVTAQQPVRHQPELEPPPGAAQGDLFEQYTRVLQELARRQPLLLLIDDAQWADAGSSSLLFHLGRRLADSRILLVVTYRPADLALGQRESRHPLEAVIYELERIYGPNRVDLDRTPGLPFVEALLDAEPNQLGSQFGPALFRQTEGHALFTVELLRAMQERGDIVRDVQGRWVEGPSLNWDTLPARVQAVIKERIGRLPEALRDLLSAASVEGSQFTAQVVAAVQDAPELPLLRALSNELHQRHRLVEPVGDVQVGRRFLSRYRFTHALFQQYLYNSLAAGEKRLLHGEIARTLEELYQDQLERIIVALAHHTTAAGQSEKAVEYLLQAGNRARSLYAHQEAIENYRQALAFLKEQGDPERMARTFMKLGLTYHNAFNFKQARKAYEEGFLWWQRSHTVEPVAPLPAAPHPLRLAWGELITIDPSLSFDNNSDGIVVHLFSGLVEQRPTMEVMPDVARRWDVSSGGRSYLFHLRDDVRWSDGRPVTAGDFVFAWRRVLDPASETKNATLLYDVKGAREFHQGQLFDPEQVGIKALDELTLAVELEQPTGYFPNLLTSTATYPVPRHVVETFGRTWTDEQHIVTNGPFQLESWQPGQLMTLSRNPAYHGRFSGNVFRVVLVLPPGQPAVKKYEVDELDIFNNLWTLPVADWDPILQRHPGEHLAVPELSTHYVRFDLRQPPFDDRRVRQAFAMATDREELADSVLHGLVAPATGGFIPPGLPGHSPEIGSPYDPDQARKLLAEAGFPAGHGFPVVPAVAPVGREGWCEYLQAQWREQLGVTVNWEILAWPVFFDRLESTPAPLVINGWVVDYPDPDNFLRIGGPWAEVGWQNEAFFRLIEEAQRATDQRARMQLYNQAERLLVDDVPLLPLIYRRYHMLIKPWVKKYPTAANRYAFWKEVILTPH